MGFSSHTNQIDIRRNPRLLSGGNYPTPRLVHVESYRSVREELRPANFNPRPSSSRAHDAFRDDRREEHPGPDEDDEGSGGHAGRAREQDPRHGADSPKRRAESSIPRQARAHVLRRGGGKNHQRTDEKGPHDLDSRGDDDGDEEEIDEGHPADAYHRGHGEFLRDVAQDDAGIDRAHARTTSVAIPTA